MTGHLAVAIVLVGGVAWILPGLLMQRVGVSATVAGGIGAALLFLASASTLWVMDLYGEPLRFADPAQKALETGPAIDVGSVDPMRKKVHPLGVSQG